MSSGWLSSFIRNYFRFENSYHTVGGWKKQLQYFIRMGHIPAHLVDRIKFRIFPKFDIVSRFPSHIDIETASACQMRCPMCYTTHMPEEYKGVMKWELYTNLIDQAKKLGVYSIKLSWRGEPLLNKRIIDMVRYAKQAGIKEVAFLSNGELLSADKAEALVDAGLDWISFSADGVGEIYNEIRFPAIFEQTIERVRHMKQYRDGKGLTRPLIRVQSIMSAVENDADEFYAAWTGVVDRLNIIADEIRDFNDKSLEWDKYFVCAKPWQRLTIAYDGKVHQCISDYGGAKILGDTNQTSLYDIWHGTEAEAVRQAFRDHDYIDKNPGCRLCSYGLVTKSDVIDVGGTKMGVRRYEGVNPVVSDNTVHLKTPEDKKVKRQPKRNP